MKKTNKLNPLTVFNNNKAMAYKKAGGEMAAFKKSLTKAQAGISMGPITESQSTFNNAMGQQPIPYANRPIVPAFNMNSDVNQKLNDLSKRSNDSSIGMSNINRANADERQSTNMLDTSDRKKRKVQNAYNEYNENLINYNNIPKQKIGGIVKRKK
jgi:hypothetical protein